MMTPSETITSVDYVVVMLVFALSSVASFLISVPLSGILIRVRANYVPKPLQLDAEVGEPVPEVVDNSYFGMMKRVYRIEGWSGLYKGIWGHFLAGIVSGMIIGSSSSTSRAGKETPPTIFGSVTSHVLFFVISLPFVALIYRSVVTPYKLPFSRWTRNLRTLFTDDERRHFWSIYTAPGLLFALFLQKVVYELILFLLASYTLYASIKWETINRFVPLSLYAVITLLLTAVGTPLEVVIAKLAVQRNGSDSTVDLAPKYPGAEDVMRFRDEEAPYEGLVDCVKKIIHEEGWKALFRCWYISLLGSLVSVFALVAALLVIQMY